MTEAEKRQASIEELTARGIPRDLAAPPFYRFLWRLGFKILPPFFQTFGAAFLGHFMLMPALCLPLVVIGTPMVLANDPSRFALFMAAWFLGASAVLGVAVGFARAGYYRAMRKDLWVPPCINYFPGEGQIRYEPVVLPGVPRAERWRLVSAVVTVLLVVRVASLFTHTYAVATGIPVAMLDTPKEKYLVTTRYGSARTLRTTPTLYYLLRWERRIYLTSAVVLLPLMLWAGPRDYRPAHSKRSPRTL